MATITQLPHEVIVHILQNESISAVDLMRFSSTCTRLQKVIHDNKLCERKYYQSCPTAEKKYNREKQKKIFHHINFQKKLEAGLYCIQKLKYYAIMMSQNKLCDTNKEQLERLLRSYTENSTTYYFVWDEINRISAQTLCKLFSNLTSEYNFKLIFHCLKQYRFVYKQMKFINMPKTKQLLEKQLTIVAQHFQPHVSYSIVKTWLDGIAQTVLSRLKNKYPAHSICSTTLEQFSFWRDNNIDDNFWNETESKQIMCVLEEYIFSELEIHKLHQLLMTSDLEAKYIKYIAVYFRQHLLTVTYHIVARRLGIHSILGLDRRHIAIIWKPKYTNGYIEYGDNVEYFYICQNSNLLYPVSIIRGRRYIRTRNSFLAHASSLRNDIWITLQMMENFYHELIRNHNIHYDGNFNILLEFLLTCSLVGIDHINIEFEYKQITNKIEVISDIVKRPLKIRSEKVKFAVGMIVTHHDDYHNGNDYNNHDGVIIGWHYECESKNFLLHLKTSDKCPYQRKYYGYNYHFCICNKYSARIHQTHYIVLIGNNSVCYVPQDQLSILPPKKINNIEIGKYFSRFEGTYYVPNESLRKRYPDDTAAIAKILAK